MKIKYVFDRIKSKSDTIDIKMNNIVIKHYNKNDWGTDWQYLINKPIYINEEDCYDLSLLTSEGAEPHNIGFDEELNSQWKPIAIKYLGTNHLEDTAHLTAIKNAMTENPDLLIKVVPQNNEKYPDIYDKLASINSSYNAIFDFSNVVYDLDSAEEVLFSHPSIGILPKVKHNGNLVRLDCRNTSLKEVYIDKNFNTITSAFKFLKTLKKVTFDPDCKIKSCAYAFERTGVEELVIPSFAEGFQNSLNYCNMYSYCGSLKKVDLSGFPQATFPESYLPIAENSTVVNQHFDYIEIQPQKYYRYVIGGQHTVGVINMPYDHVIRSNAGVIPYHGGSYLSLLEEHYIKYPMVSMINSGSPYYYSTAIFANHPTKIAAIPALLASYFRYSSSTAHPDSSDIEWWVDNTKTFVSSSLSIKQITEDKTSIDIPVTTVSKSDTVEFSLPEKFIEPVESYPHEFKLDSIKNVHIDSVKYSGTATLSDFTYNKETGKFTVNASNIADDKIGTATLNLYLFYKAIIDGHDFHGTAVFKNLAINLTFTIDEDVVSTMSLVSDDEATADPLPCYDSLPTASETLVGKSYVYNGESTDDFENGATYVCVDDANKDTVIVNAEEVYPIVFRENYSGKINLYVQSDSNLECQPYNTIDATDRHYGLVSVDANTICYLDKNGNCPSDIKSVKCTKQATITVEYLNASPYAWKKVE